MIPILYTCQNFNISFIGRLVGGPVICSYYKDLGTFQENIWGKNSIG